MVKSSIAILARLIPALALFSCAPKANVVVEMPAPKTEKAEEPALVEAPQETPPNDGFRMPDLYTLPDDSQFRSTSPGAPTAAATNTGAVIARPPTDPPSRPKPTDDE